MAIPRRTEPLTIKKENPTENNLNITDMELYSEEELHKEEYSDKYKTKYKPLPREEILNMIGNTKSSIGVITSDILLRAPEDFFDRFSEVVNRNVISIQNTIAADQNRGSEAINRAKSDPTNAKAVSAAESIVRTSITRHNDSALGASVIREFSDNEKKTINALVEHELLGFGPIEPLWRDTNITEIIVNGPKDVQVEINGRLRVVPSCNFRDKDHLLDLIDRLYRSINKTLSRNEPIIKGRLHDKSRMMAIHPVVAPDGPNFNIRRHSDEFVTVDELKSYGTFDSALINKIGNLIYAGASFLVVGGTSTGKTTLLDALTSYIRPNKRCISLEDNLEMKPHPDKLFAAAMETITPKPGVKASGVTMRDLVKASLQMRPETIIIGEVTDDAAYDLCQELNTGHDGGSTVHANSPTEAITRMMSLISQSDIVNNRGALRLFASAFDLIIMVDRFQVDGSRKITSVSEVGNTVIKDADDNYTVPLTTLWEFLPDNELTMETKKVHGEWLELEDVSNELKEKLYLGMSDWLTEEELNEVIRVKGDNK